MTTGHSPPRQSTSPIPARRRLGGVVANGYSRVASALVFCAAVGSAGAEPLVVQSPPPGGSAGGDPEAAGPPRSQVVPMPAATAPRLEVDIERNVAEALARDASLALPRFKEDVEVREGYREALDARLRGVDLACGASEQGPPTPNEMNPYRGATIPVHADFLAPAKLIVRGLDRLFGSKTPHYFLYAVYGSAARDASAKAGASAPTGSESLPGPTPPPSSSTGEYVLRDAPISENARASVPGSSWDLVASFRDRDSALAALDRLRAGFATVQRAHDDDRLPPWVSTTCRPPRID